MRRGTRKTNPLYLEERRPKRVLRWVFANLFVLPLDIMFIWVTADMCLQMPWWGSLIVLFLMPGPFCVVLSMYWLRTVAPRYRRSMKLVRSMLTYREAARYLEDQDFILTSQKELRLSDHWIYIKGMFVPKNLIITTAQTSVGGSYRTGSIPVIALILANDKSETISMRSRDEAGIYLEELNKALPNAEKLGRTGAFIYFDKKMRGYMQGYFNDYLQDGGSLERLIGEWGEYQRAMRKKVFPEALRLYV